MSRAKSTRAALERELADLRARVALQDQVIARLLAAPPAPQITVLPAPAPMPAVIPSPWIPTIPSPIWPPYVTCDASAGHPTVTTTAHYPGNAAACAPSYDHITISGGYGAAAGSIQ
jgi:hypothetical protein